ncbi:hypothetical protein ACFT7U_36295 [Streptomyces rochei]|uniref:hypothetical protein n=1 Tax=Streptomyces rochei TaxID=1928 RepID=UPI00363B6AF3
MHSSKRRLRLAGKCAGDGRLASGAGEQLVETIIGMRREAAHWGVAEPLAVATAAVRNAANQQHVPCPLDATYQSYRVGIWR